MTLWILTSLSSSVAADTASCEYRDQRGLFDPFFAFGAAAEFGLVSACVSPAVSSELQTMQ